MSDVGMSDVNMSDVGWFGVLCLVVLAVTLLLRRGPLEVDVNDMYAGPDSDED